MNSRPAKTLLFRAALFAGPDEKHKIASVTLPLSAHFKRQFMLRTEFFQLYSNLMPLKLKLFS